MDGIRIAAALAALAIGAAPAGKEREGAAPGAEHKMQCKDGTWVDRDAANGCSNHGGAGAPPAAEQGPARKSQPPDLRAHDTPAHASKYSAFGGKRSAKDKKKRARVPPEKQKAQTQDAPPAR